MPGGGILGIIPLLVAIIGFAIDWASFGSTGIQLANEATSAIAISDYSPTAVQGFVSQIKTEVKANGVDGPFTAPGGLAAMDLCPVQGGTDATCGLQGSTTYAIINGPRTTQIAQVNRGAGSECAAASGFVSGTITITITNTGGDTIATKTLHIGLTTLCQSPYATTPNVSDDQGIALNSDGTYRDTGGAMQCDPTHPADCDSTQAGAGVSSASDFRVHSQIDCYGKYCGAGDNPKNTDNFQTVNASSSQGSQP